MKNAAICAIGDEILIGQIVDTNSSSIASGLNSIGVKVGQIISIDDKVQSIIEHVERLLERFDIVITTGGLGPTKDDMTKKSLASLFGTDKFTLHQDQLDLIIDRFDKRGVVVSEVNREQAYIPEGADIILNRAGTAPGMIFRFSEQKYKHSPTLYSIPGVPYEAMAMLPDILEDVKQHNALEPICHKTILTFGIPESELSERISDWEDGLPEGVKLAYLPNPTLGVRLRLSSYSADYNENDLCSFFEKIAPLLGSAIYGEGEDNLQIVVGRLLKQRGLTVSTAESCTGGRVASLITSVPGSSSYYKGSVIAYDNSVKKDILKVSDHTLEQFGAVSSQCAEEMALGVRRELHSDLSIATTGIAGPDGGSDDKPVGLVWLAVAYLDKDGVERVKSSSVITAGDRIRNMERFSSNALNLLRLTLTDLL